MATAPHVGIDLGTTTSGLAYLRPDGTPEIVPNADGERLTPSVVFFDPFENIKLVGSSARDGGDPSRTVSQIKRHMDNPEHVVSIDGRSWTPSQISALILTKLKRECSQIIGEFDNAVVTVPANFNELARRSTIDAAAMAGINVTRLVNEPTAAALYYAEHSKLSGRVLVYDLGGGTLDVTILDIPTDGDVEILTSEGARHLGGADFDEALFQLFDHEYSSQHSAPLAKTKNHRERILQTCEEAKKMLSKLHKVTETVANESGTIARIEVTREQFEHAIDHLLVRTEMLVEQAMNSAGLTPRKIDHTVLVGGSTRLPAVHELLEKMTGQPPVSCGNVDECVALGAALFARKASTIREVANAGYGTLALVDDESTGDVVFQNSIVIPKDTPLPCECSQTYLTTEDNEQKIEVEITQGDDPHPRYVDLIGKVTLEVPPDRPAGCPVTVTFSYDVSQRVRAHILDHTTGLSQELDLVYQGAGVADDQTISKTKDYLDGQRIE